MWTHKVRYLSSLDREQCFWQTSLSLSHFQYKQDRTCAQKFNNKYNNIYRLHEYFFVSMSVFFVPISKAWNKCHAEFQSKQVRFMDPRHFKWWIHRIAYIWCSNIGSELVATMVINRNNQTFIVFFLKCWLIKGKHQFHL